MNHFLGVKPRPPYGKKTVTVDDSFNKIRDQADLVFARWAKRMAAIGGVIYCYICGAKTRIQEADLMHYVKRMNMATRYSEMNKVGCQTCNREKDGNLELYREKLVADYGEAAVQELEALGRSEMKYSRIELLELIEKYSK